MGVATSPFAKGLLGVLALSVLVWLAACVPTSEHPIKVEGQALDPALLGAWEGTLEGGGAVELFFLAKKDKAAYTAVFITADEGADGHGEWAVFTVVTAEVKGTRYLSALWDYNDGEPVASRDRGYHLIRYEISADGSLSMFGLDEEKLEDVVRGKKLPGTIENTSYTPDVRLTASPEQLAAYLGKIKPAKLFDQPFAKLTRRPDK